MRLLLVPMRMIEIYLTKVTMTLAAVTMTVLLSIIKPSFIIHPIAKTEDEIHHLKNFSLYFRVLFVFLVVLFVIFARIHFKLKAKRPNEVD